MALRRYALYDLFASTFGVAGFVFLFVGIVSGLGSALGVSLPLSLTGSARVMVFALALLFVGITIAATGRRHFVPAAAFAGLAAFVVYGLSVT